MEHTTHLFPNLQFTQLQFIQYISPTMPPLSTTLQLLLIPLHITPQPPLHTTLQLPLTTSQLHTMSLNLLPQFTDMNTPLPMTTARLLLVKMRLVMVTRPPAHTVLLFPTVVPKLLPTTSTMVPLVMSLMLHTKE